MVPFVSPIRPTLMNSAGPWMKLTTSQIPTRTSSPMPMSETTPAFRSLSSVLVTAGAAMKGRT